MEQPPPGWTGLVVTVLLVVHMAIGAIRDYQNREDARRREKRDALDRLRIQSEILEFQRQAAESVAEAARQEARIVAQKADELFENIQCGHAILEKKVEENTEVTKVAAVVAEKALETNVEALQAANNFHAKIVSMEDSIKNDGTSIVRSKK